MTLSRTVLPILLAILAPAAPRAADVPLPPPPDGTALQTSAPRVQKIAVLAGFLSEGEASSPTLQVDLARAATPAKWTRLQLELHLPIRGGRTQWDGVTTRTVLVPSFPTPISYEEPTGTTDDTV